MTEFSLSPATAKKIHHFPSLLLSDLFHFCSFILSHPLYFSYLIFFSPYLLKLLSFLSPLFITTFLFLLAFLNVSPDFLHDNLAIELSESRVSFVLVTCQAFVEKLRTKVENGGQDFHQLVELEAYKIVFEASNLELGDNQVDELEELKTKEHCLAFSRDDHGKAVNHSIQEGQGHDLVVPEVLDRRSDENLVETKRFGSVQLIVEVKTSEGFLHEKEGLQGLECEKEDKKVKPLSLKTKKVEGQRGQAAMRSGSKGIGQRESKSNNSGYYGGEEYSQKVNSSQRLESADLWTSPHNGWDNYYYSPKGESSPSLGSSFGSKKREKEWRRTLACKLFEERHNVGGGEGMDLLWEAYETDSVKSQGKSKVNEKGKNKFGSRRSEYSYGDSEDEGDEEKGNNGKLCCLEVLKFSAEKMNLGMGRPNLVKISKVFKGIGWLHNVSKHRKKGFR